MTGELSREQAPRSQPLAAVPRAGHLIDEVPTGNNNRSANCEIIPRPVTMAHVNEFDPKLMDLRAALAEVQRLLEHQAPKEPSINGEI
jgi:hypothetical protein